MYVCSRRTNWSESRIYYNGKRASERDGKRERGREGGRNGFKTGSILDKCKELKNGLEAAITVGET